MGGSSMPKADYMAIKYSAYGIHHILCNIDGNRFQPTRHPTLFFFILNCLQHILNCYEYCIDNQGV